MRILMALVTGIVLVLAQSVFWPAGESFWMKATVVGVAAISFFRPTNGLLLVAALAPFGQLIRGLLGSSARGGEALVLAFLAGALMNGWTLGKFRSVRWNRLRVSAAVFCAIVMASCLEQLWFSQLQTAYASRYFADLAAYLGEGYLTSLRGFGEVSSSMLLLEGLALLLFTAHFCRMDPQFPQRLTQMVIAGALGGAVTNMTFAITETAELSPSAGTFFASLLGRRWSAQVGDVNSAGSFFAMAAVMALGTSMGHRPYRIVWTIAGAVLVVATLMTGSRSAFVAAWIVAVVWLIRMTFTQRSEMRWLSVFGLVIAAALPIAFFLYFRDSQLNTSAALAVKIRWWFLETTWRMLQWQPLFGVGAGQYFLWSGRFSSPELRFYYPRENAHNNFAQVAGELGLVGLAAFIALLVICLLPSRLDSRFRFSGSRFQFPDSRSQNGLRGPVLAGLATFMLSWLGGHPLLVPEIAYPFWITLGIVPGLNTVDHPSVVAAFSRLRLALAALAVFLFASIPYRVYDKQLAVDLSQLDYGFARPPQNQTGDWPRRIDSRARLFVPVRARDMSIRFRSPSAVFDRSEEVLIRVNGEITERVRLSDPSWQIVRIALPFLPNRRFHRIDLEPVDRAEVEVGGWEIISAPDGQHPISHRSPS